MVKRILSVVLGLICAFVLILSLEMINSLFYAPPEGVDFKTPVAMRAFIDALPVTAFLLVLLGFILGTFIGSLVAVMVSKSGNLVPAMLVGVILMVANMADLYLIQHPLWFAVLSTAVYLPMAYLGGIVGNRLAMKKV